MSTSTYGPSALKTPANAITALRILATPFVIYMVLHDHGSYLPVVIWFFLSVSDGADGFIARRQGATRSGAFLDPLADKIIVFGVFAVLVNLGRISIWPVMIMAVREVAISVYRSILLRRGISVPAKMLGKLKMTSQLLVIGFALFPVSPWQGRVVPPLMYIATMLAILSGVQYYIDARARHA